MYLLFKIVDSLEELVVGGVGLVDFLLLHVEEDVHVFDLVVEGFELSLEVEDVFVGAVLVFEEIFVLGKDL